MICIYKPDLRSSLGNKAQNYLKREHHPEKVAKMYWEAIEEFYETYPYQEFISSVKPYIVDTQMRLDFAEEMYRHWLPNVCMKKIFIYVLESDLNTKLQSLNSISKLLPVRWTAEPVICSVQNGHLKLERDIELLIYYLGFNPQIEVEPNMLQPGEPLLVVGDTSELKTLSKSDVIRFAKLRGLNVILCEKNELAKVVQSLFS